MGLQNLLKVCTTTFGATRTQPTGDLLRALERVTHTDFGIPRESTASCIQYLPVSITERYDIAIFLIPKGQQLPLHDHPGMHVFGKILYGKARLLSFDLLSSSSPRIADVTFDGTISEGEIMQVTPKKANVHSITALENVALLDILFPPYLTGTRDCTYYKVSDTKHNNHHVLIPTYPDGYYCELYEQPLDTSTSKE